MSIISVNDVGTKLEFTIKDQDNAPVPLTGASVKLYIKRPDGTVLERNCAIDNAAGGIASYTIPTQNDLWNVFGEYQLWTVCSWGANKSFKSLPVINQSVFE